MKTNILARNRLSINSVPLGVVVLLLAVVTNIRAQFNYTTLAVPGAAGTEAVAIDGDNVLEYGYSGITEQEFIYNINSDSYTTLPLIEGEYTPDAAGISGNDTVGSFQNSSGTYGFLYNGSTYTTLSVPGTVYATGASSISDENIAGAFENSSYNFQGFLYNIIDGAYTILPLVGGKYLPTPAGISGDTVAGGYYTGSTEQGFLYNINSGAYTFVNVPNAFGTSPNAISGNNVVGTSSDGEGNLYGFLYNGSTYTTFSVPGAQQTFATGISGNSIVGYYKNSSGATFGFLATPVPEPSAKLMVAAVVAVFAFRQRNGP